VVTTKQNATAAVVNVATGITYAPQSDLLTSLTHGNGLQTTAGYDLDYRLTQLTLNNGATPVSSLAYAYSDGMNLTGITDGLNASNDNALWSARRSRGPGHSNIKKHAWNQVTLYLGHYWDSPLFIFFQLFSSFLLLRTAKTTTRRPCQMPPNVVSVGCRA
jgi:hypothetical protein